MDGTPAEIVTAAFSALRRQDWRSAARFIAPESLVTIQEFKIASMLAMQELPPLDTTGGQGSLVAITTHDSDSVDPHTRIRMMPGSPTIGELRALSPADFFVRWQKACYHVPWLIRVLAAVRGFFVRDPGDEQGPTPVDDLTVVGAVTEGTDLAHVVYRKSGYVDPWKRGVLTLKRSAEGWGIVLHRFPSGSDPFQSGEVWLMARAFLDPSARLASWFGRDRPKSD